MKCPILVRDIEIFKDWFKEDVDVYKARDVDEFVIKTKKIVENKLPSLTDNAIKKVKEKDIKTIGKQLKEVYQEVLKKD